MARSLTPTLPALFRRCGVVELALASRFNTGAALAVAVGAAVVVVAFGVAARRCRFRAFRNVPVSSVRSGGFRRGLRFLGVQ